MTTDRRLPVMARIRVPKRTYAFQSPPCIPSQRCRPLGLTRLRLCTNFTLGTYGFPVCVLLSLNQRHLQTCSSEVLPCPSAPVALFVVPAPLASFPSLCRSIYLWSHILGAYVLATICLPFPSSLCDSLSRDTYGFTSASALRSTLLPTVHKFLPFFRIPSLRPFRVFTFAHEILLPF